MEPFPWSALPRLSRREASIATRTAALFSSAELERVAGVLGALLEVEVSAATGATGHAGAGSLAEHLGPIVVSLALEHPLGRVAVELDASLSVAAVDRVLGGDGVAPPLPGLLTPVEQGVLAYLAARCCEGTRFRVVDVLTTREGLASWLGDEGSGCLGFTLGLGARRGPGRIWVPRRTLDRAASGDTPAMHGPLGWLGELAVVLGVRVGRATLESAQIADLQPGDVVIADELSWGPSARDAGEALLVDRSGAIRVRARWRPEGWTVGTIESGPGLRSSRASVDGVSVDGASVRGTSVGQDRDADGGAMSGSGSDREGTEDELARVAEIPVELAIELGRIELRVRELAALAPGRVISARLPVGGEVALRAGDRTVAVGELVDIEGELGVRILRVLP